jgi:phenylacetate-CoA ligase
MDIEREYRRTIRQDGRGASKATTRQLLIDLLDHCKRSVPYYADLMKNQGNSFREDPEGYLTAFPILTKVDIRKNFERLKSTDLNRRKWRTNTTGGSTGEPGIFIQDYEFLARVGAIQWLSNLWAGRKLGEPAIRVWGSERDVLEGTMGLKSNLIYYLTNDTWFNGFFMTPPRMRALLERINTTPPQLMIGYSRCLYELARFAEEEGIAVAPQKAILSAADMLYPAMREKIEAVFQCIVFNRYGSREVGDVACECGEHNGLHVFPLGNYVEIVDDEGHPLPLGTEGNIVLTSLTNYAMPLVRYFIGDRGILSPVDHCRCGRTGQILQQIIGRTTDVFQTNAGTLVEGGYFAFLLHYRAWLRRFQVVQKTHSSIVFRVERTAMRETKDELDEIIEKTKVVMGRDCIVTFEFVEELKPGPSGKYQYIVSEIRPLVPAENKKIVP